MNAIYRLVWNAARGAFVVASEFAASKGKGKNGSRRKNRTAGNESVGISTSVLEPGKARTKSTGRSVAGRLAIALALIAGAASPAFSQVGSIIPGVPTGAPGSGGNTGNPGIWVNDSMTGGCLVAYDSISGTDH